MKNTNYNMESSSISGVPNIAPYQQQDYDNSAVDNVYNGGIFDNTNNDNTYIGDEFISSSNKPKDTNFYFNSTADKARELLSIVNFDFDYDGKLPEYSKDIPRYVQLITKMNLDNILKEFPEDNMKKAVFELVIEATKEKIKKTNENKTLNSDFKKLKISVHKDELKALEDMYKNSGLKEASWLEKTIKKIPVIASSLNENWKGVSNIASQVIDLAIESNRTKFKDSAQVLVDENQYIPSEEENLPGEIKQFNAEMAVESLKLKNRGKLDKHTEKIQEQYYKNSTRYNPQIIQSDIGTRSINLKNSLLQTVEDAELNTPELKAAFYKLEEASCREYLKKVEREIENRTNGDKSKQNEDLSNLTIEELLEYKKILENDEKTIHSLYRSVVPSWLESNSDAIQKILITAAIQIAQHSNNSEKVKQYIKILDLKL